MSHQSCASAVLSNAGAPVSSAHEAQSHSSPIPHARSVESVSFRTYHELTGDDRSRLGDQVASQRARVHERLRSVRRSVAVVSGKGGVGKSWVTAGLARALASTQRVGVLDADLHGPTIARLLAADGPLRVDATSVEPARTADGVRVMSTDLLLADGAPFRSRAAGAEEFTRRGIVEAGVLREFLSDVDWGTLDWLLADLPPGTNALEDLAGLVPELTGALVVTIPSDESRRAVARTVRRALDCGVPLLGIVENMSGYACADCGRVGPLFDGAAGDELAEEFGVPVIARLPFVADPRRGASPRLTALATALLAAVP